ncbi:MAG: tetratricopeptide repeat protein [Prevotella sp.]|nr:tetratricopeptide repeat protein [Prevotella sp.]
MTAEDYYLRGNQFRKMGNYPEAINNYIEAMELDPESPAKEAKSMLDDVLEFYCKDFYNP